MAFTITSQQLTSILSTNHNKDALAEWLIILNHLFPQYGINSTNRAAMFLAQCGHESNDFAVLQENLNYRAESLLRTWPSRFTKNEATEYARRPEKIANRVYANRMGNGDEQSGDGWKFHGRGIVQITGKENYTITSKALFDDTRLLSTPDLLLEKEYAAESALNFWKQHSLNDLADNQDVKSVTKRINGGTLGFDDRLNRFNRALEILSN